MIPEPLADASARTDAGDDLDTSFVVEAGAGTGKTTLLVDRILTILSNDRAGLDQIVAITFTEKAAGELKIRLRQEIERRYAEATRPLAQRDRLQIALEDLERAHVSTIHAFCAGLLREHSLAAGVDPAFTVLDELGATLLRHRVWEDWLAAEMDANASTVSAALASGVELSQLRDAAFQWLEQRDLMPLVPAACPVDVAGFRRRLDERLDRLLALRVHCRDEHDGAWMAIDELARYATELAAIQEPEVTGFLLRTLRVRNRAGNKRHWDSLAALGSVRALLHEIRSDQDVLRAGLGHNQARAVAEWLGGFLERYQAAKNARGALDFDDLLVITRDALRRDRHLRRQVQRRFRYVLVDEFQDTDPLQAEIVFLLAESSPQTDDWQAVHLAAGKLFIVGDPQQSIYRFRRADLTVYEAAKAIVARQGRVVRLQTNFRSTAPVIAWINQRFPPLLEQPDEGLNYAPLFAGPASSPVGGYSVVWLPIAGADPATSTEEMRRLEARTVAALLRHLVQSDGWLCRHGGAARRLRFGDVAVLFRRHDSMRHYQEELREFEVPYRVVGGRRLFRRQEMAELHALLSAVANPNDGVAVVATLRSLFCGVSDEELFLFRRRGGHFDYTRTVPAGARGIGHIGAAFAWLGRLHQRAREVSCARLLSELLASTHYLALLYLKPQGEQLVANILKVVDLARDLERDGVDTLTGFVRVIGTVRELEVETEESPVSEAGDDVVRLLTIHKSKGLEFPVVILAGGGLDVDASVPSLVADRLAGQVAFRLGGKALGLETRNWTSVRPQEEQRLRAEEMRLLYVAATRAQDCLVLPRLPEGRQGSFLGALAAPEGFVFDTSSLDAAPRAPRAFRLDVRLPATGTAVGQVPHAWEGPAARRLSAEASAIRSVSAIRRVRATPVAAGLDRTSPGGATLGSVVHHALRRTNLREPEDAVRVADVLARAAGLAEDQRALARRLVRRALTLPSLRRAAAAAASYREMPFAVRWKEVLVEGVIDLAFIEDDALVVVDFKTDRTEAGGPSAATVAKYRPQAVLYAFGLQRTMALPVREVWLSFLRSGSEECVRADWDAEAAELVAGAV